MSFLSLFKSKVQKSGLIFIVEDNKAYAETLKAFLKADVPEVKEIKTFPVGETCLLQLHKNPDLVIIDYYLDSKYYDAETGIEIVKQIRADYPEMNILLLSSQNNVDVVVDAMKKYNCSYVKKDDRAFGNVSDVVKEIYK
jgi:DNA-binding NtrC family response regulator